MPAARGGAPRPGGKPVDDKTFPAAMPAGPEPSADAIARHREGDEDRLTPVLRNTVPACADPLDSKLNEVLAHSLEVGFWQRPGWGMDRHSRWSLAVDNRPAPFEQR